MGESMKICTDFNVGMELTPFIYGFAWQSRLCKSRRPTSFWDSVLHPCSTCSEQSWTKLFSGGGAALWTILNTKRILENMIELLKLLMMCIKNSDVVVWCCASVKSFHRHFYPKQLCNLSMHVLKELVKVRVLVQECLQVGCEHWGLISGPLGWPLHCPAYHA